MPLIKDNTYKAKMDECLQLGRALQGILWSRSFDSSLFGGFEYSVFYVLFLRAERSLASIRVLVRLGLFDDAMALVRVMVEKVITAEYILLMGEEPASDFIEFHAFSEWRTYQAIMQRSPKHAPDFTEEHLKKLKALHDEVKTRVMADGSVKSRYGRGHDWTELSLLKRAEKVDALLKERRVSVLTCFIYDASYRKSSAYLHASATSIGRSFHFPPDGRVLGMTDVEIHARDSDPQIGLEALDAAETVAFQMLTFVAGVFKDQKAKKSVYAFATKHLRPAKAARPKRDHSGQQSAAGIQRLS